MKTIVFALGYADYAMAQSGYGCYGSELAFTYLYNQLKKKYQVYLLTDFKVPGFNLLTSEQYEKGSYDYLIVSRYINFFLYHTVRASKVLIWLHDVGLQPAFMGGHLPDGGKYLLANAPVDTIVAQTEWHSNVFSAYYETKEKMEVIGNGFNQSAWTFNATSFQETLKKDEMSFIYTSSPKRGLRWLIPFFPKIRAKYPNATLHIYRGDDELTDEEKKTFPELKDQGIFYHGGLENAKLAKEFLRCQFWLYPTDFSETFCISALEAMAGECLCICTNLAALTEIVADRGILLNKKVYTAEYEQEIFSAIENALKRKEELSNKARTWALQQTWEQRAVQWDKLLGNQFQSTVEEKSNQKDEQSWKSFPNQKIALSSNFSDNLAKDWKKMFPKEVPLQLIDGERVDDAVCLVINGNNSSPRNVDHLIRMESSINRGHLPVKWKDVPSILSYNGIEWHLGLDVNTLLVHSPTKTNLFSVIISGENRLPGHSLRLQFLKFLTSKYSTDDFHLYGKHPHSYPHYKGPLNTKDSGLFSYKYTFNAENTEEKGYFTEKIVDAILAECLCFYWGCPDLERYIDPRAFIRLPLENLDEALKLVVEAIQTRQWEKRVQYIRNEKRRILLGWNLLLSFLRAISGNEPVDCYRTLLINLDHRFDRWQEMTLEWLGLKYERFPAVNGKELSLNQLSDKDREILVKKTYHQKNPYEQHDYRGGVLGCIFSHLRIWEQTSNQSQFTLVLEDDAHRVEPFVPRWNRAATYLNAHLNEWDFCFLGFHDDVEQLDKPFLKLSGDFGSFSLAKCSGGLRKHGGGTFAYCVSPGGARKMLALAEEKGIPQPVDWFMIEMFSELNVWKTIPALCHSPFQHPDTDIQNDRKPIT